MLITLNLTDDRALVAIDSAAEDGTGATAPKVIAMPDARLAMVSVGSPGLRAELGRRVFRSFDAAAELFADVVMSGNTRCTKPGDPPTASLLVGWSTIHQRMAAVLVRSVDAFASITLERWPNDAGDGWLIYAAPDHGLRRGLVLPTDPDDLLPWVRPHVDYARALHPGVAIGGQLLVAEVSRGAIGACTVGSLDLPAAAQEASG